MRHIRAILREYKTTIPGIAVIGAALYFMYIGKADITEGLAIMAVGVGLLGASDYRPKGKINNSQNTNSQDNG